MSPGLRAAEWIHIVVFTFFLSLAWVRGIAPRRRAKVVTIGVAGLAATLLGGLVLPLWLPALAASVVRDWLPAALVLLVYWQAGEFFTGADERLQNRLEGIDARWLPPLLRWLAGTAAGRWAASYLELCYLLCYAMIPLSIGALYLLRLARHSDAFWAVVLSATYLSYGALPFLQTLPPRLLEEPWCPAMPETPIRRFNLWILGHASIHANTFPSAHVAASTAAALVLGTLTPWPVAVLFAAIAAGIAVGTFAGRYHFASDAVAGSLVAAAAFVVVRLLGVL